MGTIFVAYGNRDRRADVLKFAVEQASAGGFELVVFHVQETPSESAMGVRAEIESVIEEIDPYLVYDIEIERPNNRSEPAMAKEERLLKAIFDTDRDFEYVVMGTIERGPIEKFTHSSMTKAVLNKRSIPVTLVPI